MKYVFDSSFIGAFVLPDEKSIIVDKTYSAITNDDEIFIPQLLWYEISNILKNLLRRKRFTLNEIMEFYPSIVAILFITDSETGVEYSKKLLHLCNEYNLSSYDAAYLELADRKKAILCTLDENLRAAAKKHGVTVIK